MKCLTAGRHSLRRTRVCPRLSSHRFFSSSFPYRRYALTPTPRRMNGREPSHGHDTHGLGADTSASQAYPLEGYYSIILNARSPYRGRGQTTRPPEDQPKSTSTNHAQTPQEKMSIVFGTRLAGPGRQSRYNPGEVPPQSMWKTINGVPIPPRPEEPDNCCMSGCVHCVWDDYRDEIEEWAARVAKAKAKGGPEKGTRDMRTSPRSEVESASHSMDDDGGGSETNWPVPPTQDEDLFANIPVGIREFMKTEKKLRVKHQQEASA